MQSFLSIILPVTIILILLAYASLWYTQNHKAVKVFTTWLIFSVTIALMPLIFNGIVLIFIAEFNANITTILAKGELLIVCVAIGAEAIGRIVSNQKTNNMAEVAAAGGSFVLVLLSSFLFAFISAPLEIAMNVESIAIISLVIFFITLLTSASCVLLAEV